MQFQYASTQTNQTAVLHSCLKLNLPLEVFFSFSFFFNDPCLYFSLPTLENEYQQSACTCWLWLIRLCLYQSQPELVCFVILGSSLPGGSSGSSCWILGSASYQNEQRASRPADSPNTSSQRGSTASPMWCGHRGWQLTCKTGVVFNI